MQEHAGYGYGSNQKAYRLFIYLFISFHQAIGKHCRHLQSVVLSQCGSVSSKGIASLATKCRQLKRIDVAMTKVNDNHVV